MSHRTVQSSEDSAYRILVQSIGTARPSASAAIAKGLGLPASTVVSSLYRAPSVLVDGVDESIARRMVTLLNDIGYKAEAQSICEPAPEPAPLYDVAVFIENPRQVNRIFASLASFTGMSVEDASHMLMTPPGVVLGSVSEATVNAFTAHMGEGVSVLASIPDSASYQLFLQQDAAEVTRKRVLDDVRAAGINLQGESGLLAMDVSHTDAQALWTRHRAGNALRVVNSDFLRFDIVLLGSKDNAEATPVQVTTLEQVAGVPADMATRVIQESPITLMEAVANAEVAEQMAVLTDADLVVRADLITFQLLGLEVLDATDRAALTQVLHGFGLLDSPQQAYHLPLQLTGIMPELQARIIRAALEDTGARVAFVEPP